MKDNNTPMKLPTVAPTLRVIPMPSDTNAEGDIFGGWLLAQMDLAGASLAYQVVANRIVTVGVDGMNFHKPVFVGDEVSFYSTVRKTGRTSISIHVEAWARQRHKPDEVRRVTEGLFTYVALDENRKPTEIKKHD
jgi:acyl-CoA thioesterase YciA